MTKNKKAALISIFIILALQLTLLIHIHHPTYNPTKRNKLRVQLRTVGTKDGDPLFAIPREGRKGQPGNKKSQEGPSKKPKLGIEQLSFRQLEVLPTPKKKQKKDQKSKIKYIDAQIAERKRKAVIQEKLAKLNLPKIDAQISLRPPKGVKYDELNEMEKKFYGFQKRIFEQYITSFYNAHFNLLRSRPYYKNHQIKGRHHLIGSVKYDRLGNIQKVNIYKSSIDDLLHQLFENTLTKLDTVANPPKEIIKEDNNFTLYFHLILN